MSEQTKPISEMTNEEILAEIEMLRSRRAQRRDGVATKRANAKAGTTGRRKKADVEVAPGGLDDILDGIINDGDVDETPTETVKIDLEALGDDDGSGMLGG